MRLQPCKSYLGRLSYIKSCNHNNLHEHPEVNNCSAISLALHSLDELPERLRIKVRIEACPVSGLAGDCWVCDGATRDGYARFRKRTAHRISYQTLVGPIPEGFHLDHLCKVRRCINPSHLEPVTPAENLRRSPTVSTLAALRTCCPKGHPYDAKNCYGARICRTCTRTTQRLWHRAKRGGRPWRPGGPGVPPKDQVGI